MSTAAEKRKAMKRYKEIDDHRILVDYLKVRTWDWTTSAQITAGTGLTGVRVRQLCQLFPRSFVSSIYGYKLALRATKSEIIANVQSLLKRARKIVDRASALAGDI